MSRVDICNGKHLDCNRKHSYATQGKHPMHLTTTGMIRGLLAGLLTGTVALSGAGTANAATSTAHLPAATESSTDVPGKLLLMLDASGSMNEADPSGGTKMEAAKKALIGVVDKLPQDTNVGLRVYGATEEGGKPTKAACADTQLVAPIAPLDKPALTKAINDFEAKGETPIAHSLTKAIDDLGDTGPRNVILVSDGEESCVPDPCPVVKKLTKGGVDLRIDTVGFGVKDPARKQLRCIADAGDGTYYDAKDADELTTRLNKLSQQAVRDFTFNGTPITGIDLVEDEQPPADLPKLTPGLYTDELTANKDTWRAYEVERTTAESTLHVAVTTKPSTYSNRAGDDNEQEKLELNILAPDGTTCAKETTFEGPGNGFRPIVTVSGRMLGQPLEEGPDDDACQATGAYTVLVNRQASQQKAAAEIQIIEEPPVTNLKDLPEIVDEHPDQKDLPEGKAKAITGGLSFSDAAEISSGTWVDTLVPGETLLYRVKVEDGQIGRFTVNGPTQGFRFPADAAKHDQVFIQGMVYSPDRQNADGLTPVPGTFSRGGSDPQSISTSQVRYKNRYADTLGDPDSAPGSSMGGWYYYSLSVSTKDVGEDLTGQPIKVAFTVDVEGKPSGAVKYDGQNDWDAAATGAKKDDSGSKGSGDAAGTSEDEGGSPLPWIGGGLLTAVLIGLGAWFGLRRMGARG